MGPIRSGKSLNRKPGAATNSGLAQGKGGPSSQSHDKTKSNLITVETSTTVEDTTASLKQASMILAEKIVVIEEKTIFLGDLIKLGRGTREVERFVRNQESIRHESRRFVDREDVEEMIMRERDIIMNSMNNKLSDNISKGIRKGRELAQLKTSSCPTKL